MNVVSVHVGLPREVEWHGRLVRTSIWKSAVDAQVRVGRLNLEGDQQSVFESIDGSLVSAGFAERDRSSPQSGNIRVKYAKKGIGAVIVTVTPPGDEKTYHEDGIGRVLLDWPMPRSPTAEQTVAQ